MHPTAKTPDRRSAAAEPLEPRTLLFATLDLDGLLDTLRGGGETTNAPPETAPNLLDGGSGNDRLSGDDGADALDGGAGDDTLFGGGADDTLLGHGESSPLPASIRSSPMSGTLEPLVESLSSPRRKSAPVRNNFGADTVLGRGGDDTVRVTKGPTYLPRPTATFNGGGGNDALEFSTRDFIGAERPGVFSITFDGVVNDGFAGDAPYDLSLFEAFFGGSDDGVMIDASAADFPITLSGADGPDTLIGGSGPNRIIGFGGDDSITGGAGDDDLFGEHGNDVLVGLGGRDTLRGYNGDDTLDAADGGPDFLDGGDGNDSATADDGQDDVQNVETVT